MAAFGTHIAAGLTLSGIAATSTLAAGLASPPEMLLYLGLGTLGSLLPDVDADNSAPVQIAFTVISLALAFSVMFYLSAEKLSVAELVIAWLLTYLFFRWLVFALFIRLSTHRGVFHSLPAALLAGLATVTSFSILAAQPPLQSWIAGSFVAFGYVVHLILDEAYSVNLFGARTRRSLGTALKLWSSSGPWASLLLYVGCLGSIPFLPPPEPFLQALSDRASPFSATQLLPEKGWFGALLR